MKRILLFVHFNKDNGLDERVIYTLNGIKHLYDNIVFISNSPIVNRDREKLDGLTNKIIVRENKGFDFAAWRDGIKEVGWETLFEYDTLTMMNDTCHSPVWPLDKYFKEYDKTSSVDFWGASIHKASSFGMPGTDKAIPEHIQSYFMTFKSNVVKSTTFIDFWNSIKNYTDVKNVIRNYETTLTKKLSDSGFKYDAIINRESSVFSMPSVMNPSFQVPSLLLENKFPFIKIKSINKLNFLEIKSITKNTSSYPSKYIHIFSKNRVTETAYRILNFLIENVHLTFLAIGIPIVLIFAIITPPGFGGDEMAHTIRAYSISKGHLFTVNNDVSDSLKKTVDLGWGIAEKSPWGAPIYGRQDISKDDQQKLEDLGSSNLNSTSTTKVKFNNTDPYSPFIYLGAAIGFKVGDVLNLSVTPSIIIARILNSIPFFALGALAIFIMRRNNVKWIIFTLLLLPTVLSYVGTINGDPYNIAVVALFFSVFLSVSQSKKLITRKQLLAIGVASVLLAFAKVPSILLLGLLPFLNKDLFKDSKSKWSSLIVIILVSLLLFFISMQAGFTDVVISKTNSTDKIMWSLTHPVETLALFGRTMIIESPDYINRAVGVIGRNGVYIHSVMILLIYIWLAILSMSISDASKKRSFLILVYGLALCTAVVGLLYVGDPKNSTTDWVIFGIHGKYFTPYLLLLLYGVGTLSPFRVHAGRTSIGVFSILLVSVLAIISVLSYTTALF